MSAFFLLQIVTIQNYCKSWNWYSLWMTTHYMAANFWLMMLMLKIYSHIIKYICMNSIQTSDRYHVPRWPQITKRVNALNCTIQIVVPNKIVVPGHSCLADDFFWVMFSLRYELFNKHKFKLKFGLKIKISPRFMSTNPHAFHFSKK